jgi:Ca2+-binding RTX toxin-like protein
VTVDQLEGLYLAYFGRPADADGLAFYLSNPNTDIWAVAKAFSESPESQALYGATFNASVITAIYENLFNRPAEPAGLQYWSGEVAGGRLSAAGAAFGILLGAQNGDLATVNNKLAVAALFTEAMDTPAEKAQYAGNEAAATARSFIAGIDGTDASRYTGLATVDQEVAALAAVGAGAANEVIATAPVVSGSTWSVTASQPNFLAAKGLADQGYSFLQGLRSGSLVETQGSGEEYTSLSATLAVDTRSDTLNLKLDPWIADDNNDYALELSGFHLISYKVPGVEHVNLVSTGTTVPIAAKVAGWVPYYAWNDVTLDGDQLHSIVVTGDQPLSLGGDLPGLTVVDASRLDAIEGRYDFTVSAYPYGFSFMFEPTGDTPALYVTGSRTHANLLIGSSWDNVIVGGAGDDLIWGGPGGADTLTGGGGNDQFRFVWSSDSDYAGNASTVDVITDFSPNTAAFDVGGAGPHGAAPQHYWWTGDVIDLRAYGKSTMSLGIAGSAAGAAAIIKQLSDTWHNDINAALDQTTGMLYLDTNADAVVDLRIELTGVTTLTTAAFLLRNLG